jgi:hypothetical protein
MSNRLLSVFFSAGLALAAFGCGDDDGGSGDRPDARPSADSSPDDPDAGGGGLLRSGTIAVTEAAITNDLPGGPWAGGLVSIGFSDATTGSVPAPVAGYETNINGCLIRIWDVGTNEASDAVDEGAVQVTGTENGDFGCAFVNADTGYVCQPAAGANGSAENATLATNALTFVGGGTTVTAEMLGMYVRLGSFNAAVDGNLLPIVGVNTETDSLIVGGTGGADLGTGDADSTYSLFVGVAPVPAGGAAFLLGAADAFTVQKAAGDVVGAIDEDFEAEGQGFELLDDAEMGQYLPSNIPFDESPVTFACEGDGCGAEGSGGVLPSSIVISGETTDAPVDDITSPANAMPAPENQYATFQCSFIGADTGTLDAGAMAAILGTSPTRIQVSVGRYRGSLVAAEDGSSSTIVLQGHALLGWSDPPPE